MVKYISNEIDELLGVSYLREHFIVSSFKDRAVLEQTSKSFGIQLKGIIVYSYEDAALYDIAKINGFDGVIPDIVANVFFDYASNDVAVSNLQFSNLF